jgi:hypothetical protein
MVRFADFQIVSGAIAVNATTPTPARINIESQNTNAATIPTDTSISTMITVRAAVGIQTPFVVLWIDCSRYNANATSKVTRKWDDKPI